MIQYIGNINFQQQPLTMQSSLLHFSRHVSSPTQALSSIAFSFWRQFDESFRQTGGNSGWMVNFVIPLEARWLSRLSTISK